MNKRGNTFSSNRKVMPNNIEDNSYWGPKGKNMEHWLSEAKNRRKQIAGLAVVVDPKLRLDISVDEGPAAKILSAFAGPYSSRQVSGRVNGLDWAAFLPGEDQALSTFSYFTDSKGLCIIEGEFYSDAWGYQPQTGVDTKLAQLVIESVVREGKSALAELNGVFSGLVYFHEDQLLWCFVDRLGPRMLYYRVQQGRYEVSSSIYGFRGGVGELKLDPLAINEHLIFGAPVSSKTVLDGVKLVPPGKVVELSQNKVGEQRYYSFPERWRKMSKAEAAETICQALEQHVRHISARTPQIGIALSGGKDSRVVLSALLHEGIVPIGSVFVAGDEPDRDGSIALGLSELAGVPCQIVRYGEIDRSLKLFPDAALMMDGYSGACAFLVLAAAASEQSPMVFTGVGGNILSGAWSGIIPWKLSSPENLAKAVLNAQGTEVPPAVVCQYLRPDLLVPSEQVFESWSQSFRPIFNDTGDMLRTYMLHRISHRHHRRIAPIFNMMRISITPIHPFADRFVVDTYLRLPREHLVNIRAHTLAAMHRYPKFGKLPTLVPGIPLKYEHSIRHVIRAYRFTKYLREKHKQLKAFTSTANCTKRSSCLSEANQGILAILKQSELFNSSQVVKLLQEVTPARGWLNKLGALSVHVAHALHSEVPAVMTPFFF